jgi:hypothetical protein
MNNLGWWLRKYYDIQDRLLLVYRENEKTNWSDRVFYLDEKYNPQKPYNHRVILKQEVVIEFDDKDPTSNLINAKLVASKLRKEGVKCAVWSSGNKSTHVHTLIDVKEAKNIPLLKNVFMRHYTEGLPLPDLRLATENHLIRAEFGIHEKTGKQKILIHKDKDYPVLNNISHLVWTKYFNRQRFSVESRMNKQVNRLVDHPGLKWILTSEQFRQADDGRERALFMLIHVLKPDYKENKQGLVEFLCEWYHYSGGHGLSDNQIKAKVNYHWNKQYDFTQKYLHELLESLGRTDLICEQKKELL